MNNALSLSVAWVEAGRQLTSAMSSAGRSGVEQGGKQWLQFGALSPDTALQLPALWWLDNWARGAKLFDEALVIVGEVQKAAIRSTDFQVRIIDASAVAAIERARKSSPRETELALDTMKESLLSAEKALHELSEAAIESVDSLESRA